MIKDMVTFLVSRGWPSTCVHLDLLEFQDLCARVSKQFVSEISRNAYSAAVASNAPEKLGEFLKPYLDSIKTEREKNLEHGRNLKQLKEIAGG